MAPGIPPTTPYDLTSYAGALEWLYAQTRQGLPRDPARSRYLLDRLKIPMPPFAVHVVGTNGKGTVTSMIAAAHSASGKRTGRFISPHVEDFRERISIDGVPIHEADVIAFVQRAARLTLEPTAAFFELSYALALAHFARHQVDIAVMEAGIGAKHDATITLGNVRSVVITSIGLDHLDTLGQTIGDITRDKAEAIRPGVPTITAVTGEARAIIADVASQRRSPLFLDIPNSSLFSLPPGLEALRDHEPVRWQNARLAAATLRIAGEVDEKALEAGLNTAKLPARAEIFYLRGRKVILDGAHNPSAATALTDMLAEPYVLLFGALPKKLGEETLGVLEQNALNTFITQVNQQASTIAQNANRHFIAAPIEALEQALEACPQEACILIAGSLYLAGELRPYLRANSSISKTTMSF